DVDSDSEKQLAIAIAKNADDVKHVDDNLRIDKES
ncbi:BON domain-containing protein, partial [Pseudoalteromonas holothuriae]